MNDEGVCRTAPATPGLLTREKSKKIADKRGDLLEAQI